MFAIPGFRMPPPILVADYTRTSSACGETLQALKGLESLEIRTQRSVLQ